MESKYDRVAYPENAYLHSDNEQEEFGTGVYPGVSIVSRNYKRDDTIKLACFKVKRKFSKIIIAFSVLIIGLLLLSIILIASGSKHNSEDTTATLHKDSNDKEYGLFFEPHVKHSSLIKFSPKDHSSVKEYLNSLDFHTHNYSSFITDSDPYIDCKDGQEVPEGKVCRQLATEFGEDCIHLNSYGYFEGRPCVLLTLKLKPDQIPQGFSNDSKVGKILGKYWSPNHIGVTCEGETEDDRKHIGSEKTFSSQHKLERPIQVFPETGFPKTFFPQKNKQKYIPPAVMVQFNTVMEHHVVSIKCVAWVSNFHEGENPEESNIYTAKFQFLMT